MRLFDQFRCPCCGSNRLVFDPGVDWVGRVARERLLADLDARALRERERDALPRALTFKTRASAGRRVYGGTQNLSK